MLNFPAAGADIKDMSDASLLKTPAESPFLALEAACWVCDDVQEKRVPRRSALDRQFVWTCTKCEVEWFGPGRLPA